MSSDQDALQRISTSGSPHLDQLVQAQNYLAKSTLKLRTIDHLNDFLLDVVNSMSELLGSTGGAYGLLDENRRNLLITDSYPRTDCPSGMISRSFVLPIQSSDTVGWQSIIQAKTYWWADINDPRFTNGFREYHAPANRNYFAHFPIWLTDHVTGFLGFSFTSPTRPSHFQVEVAQLMSQHAALAVHVTRLARDAQRALTAEKIAQEFEATNASLIAENRRLKAKSNAAFSRRVVQYIDEALGNRSSQTLRSDQLARYFGYSTRRFHELFRDAFDQTPHHYVMSRRLELAKKLLERGNSVSWVADECGFADVGHLAKRFRARFGSLPSEISQNGP